MNSLFFKIKNLIISCRKLGIGVTFLILKEKFINTLIDNYEEYEKLFQDKDGIEIGGPSKFFEIKGTLPVYNIVASLDTLNFSDSTIWEGVLKKGNTFKYDRGIRVGYQHIVDATDLSSITSEKYEFLLSCNVLEHIANPLKALHEWKRIIKPGGSLLLILPRKESNFDHNRKITSFEHLVDNYNNNVDERDLSSLQEILKYHDLSLDPEAGNKEMFEMRSKNNFENRALHHHVFDMALLKQIYQYLEFEILLSNTLLQDFVIVGRKK